jgi:hypothetical protein
VSKPPLACRVRLAAPTAASPLPSVALVLLRCLKLSRAPPSLFGRRNQSKPRHSSAPLPASRSCRTGASASRATGARCHPHEASLHPLHQSPSSLKQLLQRPSCVSPLPVSVHASSSQLAERHSLCPCRCRSSVKQQGLPIFLCTRASHDEC